MTLYPSLPKYIAACARRLRAGEVIALPTETVYGLAADATNAQAVATIYDIKQRPAFNPLICHIASLRAAKRYGIFNANAQKLATHFWPGPLTLVVPRKADCPICDLVSAGLPSIALRCPSHPVMAEVLRAAKRPLAAPSANPSGRLSPATAEDVRALLPDIDVLDGGHCAVGVESTIIGCLGDVPVYLRAGGIARSDIETCLNMPLVDMPTTSQDKARLAPGQLARHYAPIAPLKIDCAAGADDDLLLGFGANAPPEAIANLSPSGDLKEAAANLFTYLHRLDKQACETGKGIAIMPIPHEGLGEAINDRLRRAQKANNEN